MFLTKVIVKTRRFLRRKDGASGIEYAIIAAMVAVAIIAFLPTISTSVGTIFSKVDTALSTAAAKP
ncbi:Flp family type IVb pilin [Pseudomonas sp. NA-150]|uniref:Flp family type IVb pilin n=1 Tax=Pseudomonas sp. NA-150 TaxID=3367525 RepID=UPI0037C60F3C